MKQEEADQELFARLSTLCPDERRHLLALLKEGGIMECSRSAPQLPENQLCDSVLKAIRSCPPSAELKRLPYGGYVIEDGGKQLGSGVTPTDAWLDAELNESVLKKRDELILKHAACSGFAVVLRYGGNRYKSVCHSNAGRGIRADEVWIFGDPQTHAEREVWQVVAPILPWVPEGMIHRIPNAKPLA